MQAHPQASAEMNTDHLSRHERNELNSFREAIDYAWQAWQLQQFMLMHKRAATWALVAGMQAHELWFEDVVGAYPHGVCTAASGEPWHEATQWLIGQGWQPGEEILASLMSTEILVADDAGTEQGADQARIDRVMGYMQGRQGTVQARVVGMVLTNIHQRHDTAKLTLIQLFMGDLGDDVVMQVDIQAHPMTQGVADLWQERMARAQAVSLGHGTPQTHRQRASRRM